MKIDAVAELMVGWGIVTHNAAVYRHGLELREEWEALQRQAAARQDHPTRDSVK